MGLRNILSPTNQQQTSNSQALGGGILSLFEPGTTTFIQAFTDSGLVTPHMQPIRLSGSGRADVWINQDCDLQLTDRNGNLILFQENANPDALGAGASGGLIANGSFEEDTNADQVPDSWVALNDPGSNNARDTTESTDGIASYRFTSAGTGGGSLTTENFFPVNGIDDLRVEFDLRSTVAAVRNIVRVEWYDVSQVTISDTDVYDSTANPLTFTSFDLSATPPATARFAKLKLIGIDPTVLLAGSTYYDRIAAFYPTVVSGIFDNIEILNNSIISTNTNGAINLTPNGTGQVFLVNGGGAGSVVLGAIDAAAAVIHRNGATGQVDIGGGSAADLGGNAQFFGETHATLPNDWNIRAGANPVLAWDESTGMLSISTGVGAKTLAATFDALQGLGLASNLSMSNGRIYMAEVAPSVDVADFGQLYVNASNELIYRDESGTEVNISNSSGSGDVTKVGTPVNNQIGVWTGDGTLEGDVQLTFDTATNLLSTSQIRANDFYINDGDNAADGLPQWRMETAKYSGVDVSFTRNVVFGGTFPEVGQGTDGWCNITMRTDNTFGRMVFTCGDDAGSTGDSVFSDSQVELLMSGSSSSPLFSFSVEESNKLSISKTAIVANNAKIITDTPNATNAGMQIPHGVAPTTPQNGDMWTTTTGLFVRINGSTIGPLS